MTATDDYIRGALEDVETMFRRIPHYLADNQRTMAAYASHVIEGRFVEIAVLTHLRAVDPGLADRLTTWIGAVQGDRDARNGILSTWDQEARADEPFTAFGPEES